MANKPHCGLWHNVPLKITDVQLSMCEYQQGKGYSRGQYSQGLAVAWSTLSKTPCFKRQERELIMLQYIRGAWHQLFPQPDGTPTWFSRRDPRCSLVFLKQNWQSDHLKVKLFHSVQYFLAKAVSCCESRLDSDCEHSASRREFGLFYFFGVINSRGRKPLYIWQLILAMWSWWKCCWRQAANSRPRIR